MWTVGGMTPDLGAARPDPDEEEEDADRLILDPPSQPMPVARDFLKEYYASPDSVRDDPLPLIRAWRCGWWTWEGPKWVEVEDRRVRGRAYEFTEHAMWWKKVPNGKSTLEPWAPTTRKISDLLDALKAITFLHRDVDQPEWIEPVAMPGARELVSVGNGLLHIHTRDLFPHNPRYFNVTAVPFDYDPDAPEPTQWLAFLKELWPEDDDAIAALQEYFGYVLSGRTDQHKILLLVGPLRGGKGTIARILKALIGDGNCAGPTLASLGTNFGMSPLIGKPLAIVSDARLSGPNTHQVVERLLSISGEDMLTIDIKYQQPWTGTLPTRFVIISNELPSFGDSSGAIASRFIALQLTQSWLGREDTYLTGKLREELPGILSWALDGLDRLNKQGQFTEPDSSFEVMTALSDLVSPVSAFVRDRCAVGPYAIPVRDLFEAWRGWAEDNGHQAGSAQSFGKDLRAAQSHVKVSRPRESDERHREYLGITLKHRVPKGGVQ
jgi:putative DNA primase/helicase